MARKSIKDKPKSKNAAGQNRTCKDEVALIAHYLAGSLDPTVLAMFEEHLHQCLDCAAFLNTYKKTIEATKSFLKLRSLRNSPQPLRLTPEMLEF